jgi:hypothetical protein
MEFSPKTQKISPKMSFHRILRNPDELAMKAIFVNKYKDAPLGV